MKIAFGCDHIGLTYKKEIFEYLENKGVEISDCGTYNVDSCDYPDYALSVANAVANKEVDFGILVCGTGIGMSMAANKVKGVRCAMLSDTFSAHATREHNNANVMSLGVRTIGVGLAIDIIETFLNTPYSNDNRHQKRIDKISGIENGKE